MKEQNNSFEMVSDRHFSINLGCLNSVFKINLILVSNDRPMFVLPEIVQQFDGDAAEE